MAFKLGDNVRESFASSGTTISLGGAMPDSRSFSSVLANGDTTWAVARKGAEFSTGIFTYTSASNSLAQTTVFYSTNGNAAVSFSTGTTGEVFIELPTAVADTINLGETTVVSAATADIGAVQGKYIVLSGTTGPITSFGAVANKERIVKHSGESITHHATSLILIGGVNWVTTSGDISLFKSDASGNWRELWRRYADGRGVANVKKQVFIATDTYTPSVGMIFCIIECVGGGGGGGAAVGAVGTVMTGAGGGSGGYSRLYATAATIGASKAVTIGAAGAGGASGSNDGAAGGDTSVGVLCIGKGGGGGKFGSVAQVPTGGSGGVAGTGDLVSAGAPGMPGLYGSGTGVFIPSGNGGSSHFGGGALGVHGAPVAGNNAGNYGSGGSGASASNITANAAGGNGSAGVVFVTEFCSQ